MITKTSTVHTQRHNKTKSGTMKTLREQVN